MKYLCFLLSYLSIISSFNTQVSITKVWQPVKEKEIYEFKPIEPYLKSDLVSHPAYTKLGKYIYIHFQINTSGIDNNSITFSATGWIAPLQFFWKDGFGIK